jgi:soluble cytochrome b562
MTRGFKWFLLNENSAYLGEKMGDIMNALQDLKDNAKGMGSRHLVRSSEDLVNQMRRVLHTHWPKSEGEHLKRLQKVAVGIMKTVEEKGDLEAIISSGVEEIQKSLEKMGTPINDLGSTAQEEKPEQGKAETQPAEPQGQEQEVEQPDGQQVPPQPIPPTG